MNKAVSYIQFNEVINTGIRARVQVSDAAAVTCLLHSSSGDYSCTRLESPRATYSAEQIFISHKNICPSAAGHSDNSINSTFLHLLQYHGLNCDTGATMTVEEGHRHVEYQSVESGGYLNN